MLSVNSHFCLGLFSFCDIGVETFDSPGVFDNNTVCGFSFLSMSSYVSGGFVGGTWFIRLSEFFGFDCPCAGSS